MDPELTSLTNFYCNRPMLDWFVSSSSFDTALLTYEPLVSRARAGSLDHLASSPEGCIALIILLDQIPRNIYRGSAAAFASDDKAYHVAVRGIAHGFDKAVGEESRQKQTLFYLPLEHREDLGAQVAARALFLAGVAECEVGSEGREIMEAGVQVSERHLVCVRELGRFPGRNRALGRESTVMEREWLREHPQGF